MGREYPRTGGDGGGGGAMYNYHINSHGVGNERDVVDATSFHDGSASSSSWASIPALSSSDVRSL